jgi:hypothetical protein
MITIDLRDQPMLLGHSQLLPLPGAARLSSSAAKAVC